MPLDTLRLLLDFGLLILIWMVQLIAYPSFLYLSMEKLKIWHQKYTLRISLIVIPLIMGQLVLAGIQLWHEVSIYTVISSILIISVWLSTFIQFAPLHQHLNSAEYPEKLLVQLVRQNWLRTVLWTLIFIWSCINIGTA
ncbi:hypothetical protein [Spongiimicrobium salis]|uniref:hypothetical protein n=1 Tax=Spongiimicrobium salis TaxID=1667022 RepID=UPI00374DC016